MVQAAPCSSPTPTPDADAGHPSPPSRLLSKHRPRRRAAPPRPALPPTRGQPDLNRCNCCCVRCPPPAPGARRPPPIRPLRSLWRVVLLCSECLDLLRSRTVCSYCLSLDNLPSEDSGAVACRACGRCVHRRCVAAEHRAALVQPVDLDDFVCVDCCPTLKPRSNIVPKLEVPDSAVRGKAEAPAAAKKLSSLRKTVEAKPVSKCAKEEPRTLIAICGESESKGTSDLELPDDKLALQLHLAMNGSRRISRSGSASGVVSPGQGKGQKALVSRRKVNEDLGLCVTNMMDHLDCGETGAEMGSNWNAKNDMGFDPSVKVVLALECTSKHAKDSIIRDKRKGAPGANQHGGLVDRYRMKYKRKSSKQANAESTGNKTTPNGKALDVSDGGKGISPMT